MRIVAAVAHYAEPESFMRRLTLSLVDVVDEVVALGGRWELMPGDGPADWPSQVAKRDELMRRASERGDWAIVLDGDEYLEPLSALDEWGDVRQPPAFVEIRKGLAATDLDVATVTIRNLNRPWPFARLAPQTFAARRIFRAGTRLPGPAHNDYRLDGRRLAGDPASGALEPALDLTGLVTIAHDNRARPQERDRAMQTYRRARRAAGLEVAA